MKTLTLPNPSQQNLWGKVQRQSAWKTSAGSIYIQRDRKTDRQTDRQRDIMWLSYDSQAHASLICVKCWLALWYWSGTYETREPASGQAPDRRKPTYWHVPKCGIWLNPVLHTLHWLIIKYRLQFKELTHKAQSGEEPSKCHADPIQSEEVT